MKTIEIQGKEHAIREFTENTSLQIFTEPLLGVKLENGRGKVIEKVKVLGWGFLSELVKFEGAVPEYDNMTPGSDCPGKEYSVMLLNHFGNDPELKLVIYKNNKDEIRVNPLADGSSLEKPYKIWVTASPFTDPLVKQHEMIINTLRSFLENTSIPCIIQSKAAVVDDIKARNEAEGEIEDYEDYENDPYFVGSIIDHPDYDELSGCYDLYMGDPKYEGQLFAVWVPYPTDPIIGLGNIIDILMKLSPKMNPKQ